MFDLEESRIEQWTLPMPQDLADSTDLDETEQITRAAWHYYNDGFTQNRIADILGVSRIKVSRLLEKGRQSGLIELRINSPYGGCLVLQQELIDAFGLVDARVVPSAQDLPPAPRIGRAAASLLAQKLEPNDLLAIGWGETTSTTLRFTSCCTHSTRTLMWRIRPTPSRKQMALPALASMWRRVVTAKPAKSKTSRINIASLSAPAAA